MNSEVEKRLNRLEAELSAVRRQNAMLRLLMVLAFAAWFLIGPAASPKPPAKVSDPIRTTKLEIVDANGRTRLVLDTALLGGPRIGMLGSDGKPRLTLAAGESSSALVLRDENGHKRAELSALTDGPKFILASPDGAKKIEANVGGWSPSFSLADTDSETEVLISTTTFIEPDSKKIHSWPEVTLRKKDRTMRLTDHQLEVFDWIWSKGKTTWPSGGEKRDLEKILTPISLSVDDSDLPSLTFRDANYISRLLMFLAQDGVPVLNFTDADDKARLSLGSSTVHGPYFEMFDAKGNVRVLTGLADDEAPYLDFFDSDRGLRLALGETKLKATQTGTGIIRSESSVVLFDKDGKVIFEAPKD